MATRLALPRPGRRDGIGALGSMAQYVEVASTWRVTLRPVVINAAHHAAFLVASAEKAEIIQQVLEGPYQPVVLPAQIIRTARGELRWLVDAAAAAKLSRAS